MKNAIRLLALLITLFLFTDAYSQQEQQINKSKSNVKNNIADFGERMNTGLTYAHDFLVEDADVLKLLGAEKLIIKKGNYTPDFSENPYGDIKLLVAPFSAKAINQAGIKRTVLSGFRCDASCKEEGTYCFTCKSSVNLTAREYFFKLMPVIDNDQVVALVLAHVKK